MWIFAALLRVQAQDSSPHGSTIPLLSISPALSRGCSPLGCTRFWHIQVHRCSGSQGTVQTTVGGRRGTFGPRTLSCPGSLSAGSVMVTDSQAAQEPSITNHNESSSLPRRPKKYPPLLLHPIPSLSPSSSLVQSPLQPESHCFPSKPLSYCTWVGSTTPKWPACCLLVPATNALSTL